MLEVFFYRSLDFLLFWGVWLLAPLLIDLSTAVVYFSSLLLYDDKQVDAAEELKFFPYVTVIVPVHNSAETLYKCLKSLVNQSYPSDLLQVICVNNGSNDNSFEVYQKFQLDHPEFLLMWESLERAGKSMALNVGLYSGQGAYLINLDSDTWLDRDAILNTVKAFEADDTLVAATGNIRVDKDLGRGSSFMDIVNYCEVAEYLIAFDVGRRYQNMTDTLFTLSGAFSAFRRETILQSFLYQERTVSEDTDLTFNIREAVKGGKGRIGFIMNAVAYVEPIESLSRLYSQRVRWQRGEIEVMSAFYQKIPGAANALFQYTGRILISDHTLAFSRLTWTFLLPFLYFLGYTLSTVAVGMMGLFVIYFFIDTMYFALAYRGVSREYKKELRKVWWTVFFLPFYRYLSYWFRLAGIIIEMTETKAWKSESPVRQLADVLKLYRFKLYRSVFLRKGGEGIEG